MLCAVYINLLHLHLSARHMGLQNASTDIHTEGQRVAYYCFNFALAGNQNPDRKCKCKSRVFALINITMSNGQNFQSMSCIVYLSLPNRTILSSDSAGILSEVYEQSNPRLITFITVDTCEC